MAKCANCVNDAHFTYQVTPDFAIQFCSKHVPGFLQTPLYAGRLSRNKAEAVVEEPVVAEVEVTPVVKTSKKKAAPVVEEPAIVEEEAPTDSVEETLTEE
jgi:hypothetical protein